MCRQVGILGLVLMAVGACKPGVMSSTDGQELFESVCAKCHGVNGHAVAAWKSKLGVPDLADQALQARLTDEQIVETITNGSKSGRMPPWKGVFSPEQIQALAKHVRSFKK
jgi:mono/diheme cytochrome c family protein